VLSVPRAGQRIAGMPILVWFVGIGFGVFLCIGQGGESVSSTFWIQTSLLALAVSLCLSRGEKEKTTPKSFQVLPMAAFLLLSGLGSLVAPYAFSTQLELTWFFSCFCAFLWLMFRASDRTRKRLLEISVYIALAQAVYGLVQFYLLGATRAKGTFASPNHAATYIAAGVIYCYVLACIGPFSVARRLTWAILGGLGLWSLVGTGSRSVLFSMGIALISSVSLLGLAKKYLLGVLLLLAALIVVPNPMRDRLLFSRTEDIYAVQRPKIWLQSAKIILDYPLFGATLGNFEYVSSRYQFPVEGGLGRYSKMFTTADNGFLELAAETGIPGILCMLWGTWVAFGAFRKGLNSMKDPRRRAVFLGAAAVLLVLLLQNLFHTVYRSPPSVWMGMVALSIVLGAGAEGSGPGKGGNRSFSGLMGNPRVRALVCYGVAIIIGLGVWPFLCLSPYIAFRYYEKASLLHSEGKLEEAEQHLLKAISFNSKQPFFFHRLGNIQMERFSRTQHSLLARNALENFEKAVELNRINPIFWHTLGRYHEFMVVFSEDTEKGTHIERACRAYEKAAELAPTNPFYRVSLAALFIKAGELEKAIAPLEQALHLEPNFVTAQVLLIDVKEKLGYKDEAAALRAKLEETLRRVSGLRPINEYEARLLMDPARYFKDQG
jgi:O-antigen ligase